MIPPAAIAFARTWWKAGAGAVLGAALAFPLGQCSGAAIERDRAALRAAEAREVVLARDAAAKDAASAERLTDTLTVNTSERERSDAIHAAPAGRASAAHLDLGCVRLRQQGTPVERLPARCRPGGPGQADPQR